MTDAKARGLEREAEAGDPASAARALVERVRRGDLLPGRLKLAAFSGDPAALLAFACRHDDIRDGDRGCVCWYGLKAGEDGWSGAFGERWVRCMLAVFGGYGADKSYVEGAHDAHTYGTRLGARACLAAAEAVWAGGEEQWTREDRRRVVDCLRALRCWVDGPTRDAARAYELFAGPLQRQRWITSPSHALVGPLGWSYFSEAVRDAATRIGPHAVRSAMNKAVAEWALS